MTEYEAEQQLLALIDSNLLEHAAALAKKEEIQIGDVYDLQDLADIHYLLKAGHTFTPSEVEALLEFRDPLEVARWCKEDNPHKHSFPICELLEEIDAGRRFEKAEPPFALPDKYAELMKLLGRNLLEYEEKLLALDKRALIDKAGEIGAAHAAYRYMADGYSPDEEELDYLLRFDNPLELIQSYWPSGDLSIGKVVMETIADDMDYPAEERREVPQSVRERLQSAAQEAGRTAEKQRQRPAAPER